MGEVNFWGVSRNSPYYNCNMDQGVCYPSEDDYLASLNEDVVLVAPQPRVPQPVKKAAPQRVVSVDFGQRSGSEEASLAMGFLEGMGKGVSSVLNLACEKHYDFPNDGDLDIERDTVEYPEEVESDGDLDIERDAVEYLEEIESDGDLDIERDAVEYPEEIENELLCEEEDVKSSYSGPSETENIGICRERIEVCQNGVWVITQNEVLPEQEGWWAGQNGDSIVNGVDDNCNGAIDEIVVDTPNLLINFGVDRPFSLNPGYVYISNNAKVNFVNSQAFLSLSSKWIKIEGGSIVSFSSPRVMIESDSFYISEDSTIDIGGMTCGDGDGHNGSGSSDGGGAGGASHLGIGGIGGRGGYSGVGGVGGNLYGMIGDETYEPGSCGGVGGSEGGRGGRGGGSIKIVSDDMYVFGEIIANGENGSDGVIDGGGGGGGSGGAILIETDNLFLKKDFTIFDVSGGIGGSGGGLYAGGGGGGGGAGGSIEIKYTTFAKIDNSIFLAVTYAHFIEELINFGNVRYNGGMGGLGYIQNISGFNNGSTGDLGAINTSLP